MGRVDIWNGRWGLISDTNFIYLVEIMPAVFAISVISEGDGKLSTATKIPPGNSLTLWIFHTPIDV
jgi:hypothetical protein